jgi:hypothetical protein
MSHSDEQTVVEGSLPRPQSVTVALGLLVASWVAGAVLSAVGLLVSPAGAHDLRWRALPGTLVAYAIAAGLIAALAHRRRWAWWVWLVLFVLSLPFLWSGLQRSLDSGAFSAARYVLLTAAEVASAVLLLLRSSRQWYGVGREPGAPSPWRWSDSPKKP